MEEIIYDPIKKYDNYYNQHQDLTINYLENLVKEAKIDIEANKTTVKEINNFIEKKNKFAKSTKSLKAWCKFITVLYFLLPGISFLGCLQLSNNSNRILFYCLIGIGLIIIIISLVFIHVKKMKPKIRNLENEIKKINLKIVEKTNAAWEQMNPLNSLFTYGIALKNTEKTLSILNFDDSLSEQRMSFFVSKGLNKHDNKSTIGLQSGELNTNPFLLAHKVNHWIGTKVYSGSITIFWTTTSRDSKGNTTTRTHSQVLTASINKPFPVYEEEKTLIMYSDLCEKLIFNRLPMQNFNTSENFIKKELKKLDKKAEQAIKNNKKFNLMNNSEFELFFNCYERTNEVEFRLMFSPVAQKQILDVIKSNKIYDNQSFKMQKSENLTFIKNNALNSLNLNFYPTKYHSYDYEKIKNLFIDDQMQFFKDIFFSFIQIFSIPVFQERRTADNIWKDKQEQKFADWEHEAMANSFNESKIAHPSAITQNMVKTNFIKNEEGLDYVSVKADGYKGVERIAYETAWGRDGKLHTIPIKWIEYIPVSRETMMVVKSAQANKKEKTIKESIKEFLNDYGIQDNNINLKTNAIAMIFDDFNEDNDIIKSISKI
ncbi:MAG1210 family protein [Mesoplasma florum]|uniref:MAG1210 family protein n=1 Tax=Mesoplasma florum TaxID=2151 RepID=UPI000D0865EE|nr:hypothetical protein [Mesoplasma florum]AVN60992.1 hypothetical protein CG005_01645 [Mesoplasma florum]